MLFSIRFTQHPASAHQAAGLPAPPAEARVSPGATLVPQPGQRWETHLPKGPVCPTSNCGSRRTLGLGAVAAELLQGSRGLQGSSSDPAQLAQMSVCGEVGVGVVTGRLWKPGLRTAGPGIRHQPSQSPGVLSWPRGTKREGPRPIRSLCPSLSGEGPGNALLSTVWTTPGDKSARAHQEGGSQSHGTWGLPDSV